MTRKEQVSQTYLAEYRTIVVDIYCRVSTDDQENNTSFEEQEACSRAYIEQLKRETGFNVIVGMVHLETYSGYYYREREKLTLMRERYRAGIIQGVIIRTYDRLSRKEVHFGILLEEMEHYNIQLYCVKEQLEDSLIGRLTRVFLGLLAEWEREKISDRTFTGREAKAMKGKVVTGYKAPYNWKWVFNEKGERDHIEVNEDQANVTRQLAKQYAYEGYSFRKLESDLNKSDTIAPSGEKGKWCAKKIRQILIDPRLVGKGTQFNDKRKGEKHHDTVDLPEGTYPRILDDATYALILERTVTNKQESQRKCKEPEEFLLRTGFIKCISGRAMGGVFIKKGDGKEIPYYQCRSNRLCSGHRVLSKPLDEIVWHWLQQLADHADLLEEAIRLATNTDAIESDTRAIEANITRWKATVANYLEDLGDDTLTGDSRAAIRKLMNDASKMVTQYEVERAKVVLGMIDKQGEKAAFQEILEWCKTAKEDRGGLSYQQKRDFLRLLGLMVVIDNKKPARGEIAYHIEVALPKIQALIPQNEATGQRIEERNRRSAPGFPRGQSRRGQRTPGTTVS